MSTRFKSQPSRLARATFRSDGPPANGTTKAGAQMLGQPFQVREVAGLPVVDAPAEIDVSNAGQLRSALLIAAAIGPVVVVDLSGTEFCDSSGLSVLVRGLRRAQADDGELRLVVSTPAVLRVLEVTGMHSIFATFATLAEALSQPPPEPAAGP